MRTVILNTLDPAFKRKDVFFRAFAPDELLWLDRGLDELDLCAEELISLLSGQMIRQDYHLVVLTDLEHFRFSEYEDSRKSLEELVTAHLNARLLPPLDREDLLPVRITELFVFFRNRADAEKGRDRYAALLGLEPGKPVEKLFLSYARPGCADGRLDLSPTLGEFPAPSAPPAEGTAKPSVQQTEPEDELLSIVKSRRDPQAEAEKLADAAEQQLVADLRRQLAALQKYRVSRRPDSPLVPAVHEFPFQVRERSLAWADLQIGLARLVYDLGTSRPGEEVSPPVPHEERDLTRILANARESAKFYLNTDRRMKYYDVTEPYALSESGEVETRIRDRLRGELSVVPGITEALDILDKQTAAPQTDADEPQSPAPSALEDRVRVSWLSVRRELRRFQDMYHMLRQQYDRERVLEDQKRILDICSDEFLSWRGKKRQTLSAARNKPTLDRRPELPKEHVQSLVQARERCAEGILESLNDYSDVRAEAAELHTRFRAASRFWSPDRQSRNNRLFLRFSCIMALVYVLLMLLPYVLMESAETELLASRLPFFGIAFGVFILLYGAGVLHWMHRLCRAIGSLSLELSRLLYHSADARRASVLSAIETYGRLLPECLLRQMNIDALEDADGKNARLEKLQMLHLGYLNEALNEIDDLRTAMRMGELPRGEANRKELRYDLPPYARENRDAYMLFTEEGGRE